MTTMAAASFTGSYYLYYMMAPFNPMYFGVSAFVTTMISSMVISGKMQLNLTVYEMILMPDK